MNPIYLDYLATTPISRRALMALVQSYETFIGNTASSAHSHGLRAEVALASERERLALAVDCAPSNIIFGSGATEANNSILYSIKERFKDQPLHLVISAIEHKCMLESARSLERQGVEVTYVRPRQNGVVAVEDVIAALKPTTRFVSLMLVNNELGTVQPVKELAAALAGKSIWLHTDACQALGRMDFSFRDLKVHSLSLSAHKAYGPKGTGCLITVAPALLAETPLMKGGGQEGGARSGTINLPAVCGFAAAAEEVRQLLPEDLTLMRHLRKRFLRALSDRGIAWVPNCDLNECVPAVLNIRLPGILADKLFGVLRNHVSISSGSACSSKNQTTSHVLRAIGLSDEESKESLRISFGRFVTGGEVDRAAAAIGEAVWQITPGMTYDPKEHAYA